jgi:hypothetical protein
MSTYLTQDDERNFGPEMLDLAIRAARHAVSPELAQLREENQQLHDEVGRAAKLALDQVLDREVPGWRAINASEEFHRWLLLPEPYSGVIRDRLLKDAAAAGDAQRLVKFFQGFLREQGGAGQPAAAAGGQSRPRRSGPRIYTRAEIERLSREYRSGRIPEEQYLRISADIVAAGREGRILNPEPLNGLGAIG